MSKKHFIELADCLPTLMGEFKRQHETGGLYPEKAFHAVLDTLADFCAEQNPRFNRDRWMKYINGECGPNGAIYRVNLWRVRVGPFEIRRFERLQPPGEIGKPKAPLTTTEVPAWAWHCLSSLAAMVLLVALEVACP